MLRGVEVGLLGYAGNESGKSIKQVRGELGFAPVRASRGGPGVTRTKERLSREYRLVRSC